MPVNDERMAKVLALMEEDPEAFQRALQNLQGKMLIPHSPGQSEVLTSEDRFMVLCAGRRWGKTKVGAAKILRECREKPGTIAWWVSPTYRVVKRGYDEIVAMIPTDLLDKAPPASTAFDAGRAVVVKFKNGSRMEFFSAERPETMLGGSCDFLVMDEAATMKENVWTQNIAPTLADRQGRALFISTPRGRNWFYKLWLRGQSDDPKNKKYKSWHFPSRTNPTIPAEEFDDMANRLPQVEYEQEILAQFISKAAAVFNLPEDEYGQLTCLKPLHQPMGHVVLGIDLAKRDDYTVICGVNMQTRMPCYNESFNQIAWNVQRMRIHDAVNYVKRTADDLTILMDTGGVGDVVFDDLTEEGLDIIPINFTSMKEKMVGLFAADLARGRAFISEEQLDEIEHYSRTFTSTGKSKYEATGSGHDDQVSAAMLAHWGIVHEGSPQVQTITIALDGNIGGDYSSEYRAGTERFVDQGGEYLEPVPDLEGLMQAEIRREIAPPTIQELMNRPGVWE